MSLLLFQCKFLPSFSSSSTHLSADYYLDQSESYKAIDEFQLFMSKYPNSYLLDSCNKMVSDLRNRHKFGTSVSINESADFNVNWNTVEENISSKTRMIIINSPQNPLWISK